MSIYPPGQMISGLLFRLTDDQARTMAKEILTLLFDVEVAEAVPPLPAPPVAPLQFFGEPAVCICRDDTGNPNCPVHWVGASV